MGGESRVRIACTKYRIFQKQGYEVHDVGQKFKATTAVHSSYYDEFTAEMALNFSTPIKSWFWVP
jgi:hypothetical protein